MEPEARQDVPLGRRSPLARTRIVVADRNVISRVGIRSILERTHDVAVVAESTTYDGVIDAVDEHGPDVLIIDLDLGDDTTRGLKVCEDISDKYPNTKVLVLAQTLSELIVVEALRRGVTGYLCKDEVKADELIKGVKAIQDGETARCFDPQPVCDRDTRQLAGAPRNFLYEQWLQIRSGFRQ